jgi:beta-galactosidase/beta-glucuronidase
LPRRQDTGARERKCLNGLWQFALDPGSQGRNDRWFAGPLTNAREMAVPASFNDIAADAEQMWNFADFATTSGIMRIGGNKKGAFTRDRQPKAARTPLAQPLAQRPVDA